MSEEAVARMALDVVAGEQVKYHRRQVMVMATSTWEKDGATVRVARIWDGKRQYDVFVTELQRIPVPES